MNLYLSSYRVGDHPDKLKALLGSSAVKAAVSVNALDHCRDEVRNDVRLKQEIEDMRILGFDAEELDLRNFFHSSSIVKKLSQYDLVWFSGGNVFVLVKAMRQSGFIAVFDELVKPNKLVYAGYSAAFCALSPSLRGMELVDDKDVTPTGYESGDVWDGFGLIDFHPIVHFRSKHPESELVEKEYEYVKNHGIPHKTFADGDVYVVSAKT